ncbi:MAG: hypothetical protein HDS45_02395 [Bacteroides sp.]|nr:hypothetical protein [Bacteroides sp.]
MRQKNPIVTYEFGNLYIEGQLHKKGDTALPETAFNNLWDFILSNKADNDSDNVMSVHSRGGRRFIRTGRFVGTIQTRDGQVLEILPKIYKASGKQEEDKNVCRRVFINMLRHFSDTKSRSFQNASLQTKKNFPILEIYIANYVSAVEELVLGGLKRSYSNVAENQPFLKGRLDLSRHITKNVADKSRFAIRYNKFIEDIPHNRILVSTLQKLLQDSHSIANRSRISTVLGLLSDTPASSNVEVDLKVALTKNRLYSSYELLMQWSSQFLTNKGFTNFSGNCVNQSLLFQAERLFENFIAFLFKKFAATYRRSNLDASAQNSRYYLVDRHNGSGMFRLRPDIVVESDKESSRYECIIIDTKWKAIDSQSPNRNYLIDMKDMYQLYAYGQKYMQGETPRVGHEVIPKLVLLYPYSEKFTEKLPEFVYEDVLEKYGLKLMVVPFDLTSPKTYERQIHNIIDSLNVAPDVQPVMLRYDEDAHSLPLIAAEDMPEYSSRIKSDMMLVGCYKDIKHKEWIETNELYNIRLGRRNGSIDKSGLMIAASRLLLYNKDNPSDYKVYNLDVTKQVLASPQTMQEKNYPGAKSSRSYILYFMGAEVKEHPNYDVTALRLQFAPNTKNNSPFFVEL